MSKDIQSWAEIRETSLEIVEAILKLPTMMKPWHKKFGRKVAMKH